MVGSKKLSIYLGGVCRLVARLFTMEPILNRQVRNLNRHLPVQGVRVGGRVCRKKPDNVGASTPWLLIAGDFKVFKTYWPLAGVLIALCAI
jgi:hypothetical protein